MTVEEAKQELREYRDNIKYIEEKQYDIEELHTRLEKVTTRMSLTRTSGGEINTDKFSDGISKLKALEKEYEDKLQELLLKKFAIDEKIEKLEQPYKSILFLRYARGYSWNKIAIEMNYSIQNIFIIHGKALIEYSKL